MAQHLAPSVQLTNAAAGRRECRVYERHSCELPGFCQPAFDSHSPEQKWSAVVRDISQGGVGLVVSRRYERGTGLAIELTDGDVGNSRTFYAKVIYARPLAGGLWSHGCQFISPISEDELLQIREGAAAKMEHAQVRIQLVDEQGKLVRLFSKSLRISSSWPLPEGKILTLRIGELDKEPSALKIRVIHCERVGDHWKLRAQLLQSAS